MPRSPGRRLSGVADPAKLAITGFCWGGRIVWLYAAHSRTLKAGVAWYGRLVGDKTTNQPAHPIDLAQRIKAPVLGLYGRRRCRHSRPNHRADDGGPRRRHAVNDPRL